MANNRNTSHSPSVRAQARPTEAAGRSKSAVPRDPRDAQPDRQLRHIEGAIQRLHLIEDAAAQANERLRALCGRMIGHEPVGESDGTAGSHESSEIDQLHAVISATEAQVSHVVSQIERLERL